MDEDEDDGRGAEGEDEPRCELERVEGADVFLSTQVNHCSVSPDGRRMVAVGDTNEVFLFDVGQGSGLVSPRLDRVPIAGRVNATNALGTRSQYLLTHVFQGSSSASFSTDWAPNGNQFAVASEGEPPHHVVQCPTSCLTLTARPTRRRCREHLRHPRPARHTRLLLPLPSVLPSGAPPSRRDPLAPERVLAQPGRGQEGQVQPAWVGRSPPDRVHRAPEPIPCAGRADV